MLYKILSVWKIDVMAHICDASTREEEEECGPGVQGQSWGYSSVGRMHFQSEEKKKKNPRFDSQQHIKLIKAAHACDPSAQIQTLLYVDQPRIDET